MELTAKSGAQLPHTTTTHHTYTAHTMKIRVLFAQGSLAQRDCVEQVLEMSLPWPSVKNIKAMIAAKEHLPFEHLRLFDSAGHEYKRNNFRFSSFSDDNLSDDAPPPTLCCLITGFDDAAGGGGLGGSGHHQSGHSGTGATKSHPPCGHRAAGGYSSQLTIMGSECPVHLEPALIDARKVRAEQWCVVWREWRVCVVVVWASIV